MGKKSRGRGQSGLVEAYKGFIARYIRGANKNRRLHMTTTPPELLNLQMFNDHTQTVDHKPKGMWYGIGDDWMQWCLSEEPGWLCPYIYEVVLDPSQVLAINDVAAFEKFEDEHQAEAEWEKHMRAVEENDPVMSGLQEALKLLSDNARANRRLRMFHNMNYPKVAETYGAMEITPYLYSKRLDSMWYYGWDCASGCVWNRNAVKDLRLFASYDKASDEMVRASLQPRKTTV